MRRIAILCAVGCMFVALTIVIAPHLTPRYTSLPVRPLQVRDHVWSILEGDADAAAANPAAVCQSGKLQSAAKFAKAVLICHAVAAESGAAVSTSCRDKAASKFAAAFTMLESRGGCTTSADSQTVETELLNFADTVAASLSPGAAPSACGGAKLRATASTTSSSLSAQAKNRKKLNGALLARALSKAHDGLARQFARAEAKGGCATTGNAAALTETIDATVTRLAGELYPWPAKSVSDVTVTVPLPAENVGTPTAASTAGTGLSGYEMVVVPLQDTVGSSTDAFHLLVEDNNSNASLSAWFAANVDPNGTLTAAGTYEFVSFPDGREALLSGASIPETYEGPPLPAAFLMAADRSKVVSVMFTTENNLDALGYADPDAARRLLRDLVAGLVP